MSLTFTDVFCGAGGSSLGLTAAGLELRLAANHWDRAIETHSANFRDADHLCADVSNYDMRRLPSTDVLWASPECTWHSPAGGRKKLRAQLDLLEEHVPTDGGVRSRATMLDVIRAAEVHRYGHVVVENVVEVADWPLFDWWLDGLRQLGYTAQVLCLNSAHAGDEGNPHAPQWRDRLYVVFTRDGVPAPDVEPRPLAWCPTCELDVPAVQSWKNPRRRRIGKYQAQYVYRCPNSGCRHTIVEPYVLPAAAAIDWSDLGQRIGDRRRPLAAAPLRRIRAGLDLFAGTAVLVDRRDGHGPDRSRVRDAAAEPVGTVTARGETNRTLVVPPYLVPAGGTWNDDPVAVDQPMRTRPARATDGILTPTPSVTPPFVTMLRGPANRPTGLDEPLATVATGNNHYLTAPAPFITVLRRNATTASIDDPLATVTTGGERGGGHQYLTVPPGAVPPDGTPDAAPPGSFYVKHFTPRGRWGQMSKDVRTEPLGAITAADHHSLVIPYRRAKPKTTAEPLHTLATHDSAALVAPAIEVDDCHFRMLRPREHLRAQRFADTYVVLGNQSERADHAGRQRRLRQRRPVDR